MQKNTINLPFTLTPAQLLIIDQRLSEFENLGKKDNKDWFSELCFCLLTANAQAQRAINIQQHLGIEGFLNFEKEKIASTIRSFGHRFHNNKAEYIVLARKYNNIKDQLLNLPQGKLRDFLVKNIKGLGFKEASHFLRNVGYNNFAIIDRHILKFLHKNNLIDKIPSTITPKLYIEYENILKRYNIPLSKLDLMIWCHMTGNILK